MAMDVFLATELLETVDTTAATLSDRLPTVFPRPTPTPLDTPTTLESSLELTTAMDVCPATAPSATVDSTAATLPDTSATVDTLTPTESVRLRLTPRPMPTLLVRLLMVFPSTMPTPLDTPTMLESSPVLTTATDVCLATAPLATVVSMVDTTEAMLDTLEPTSDKFTLSSHHHFA